MTRGKPKASMTKCKIICKYCKETPTCLALCNCKMYNVVSKDPLMSRACIHFGSHLHPVAKDECKDAIMKI